MAEPAAEPTVPDVSVPIPQATRRIPRDAANQPANGHAHATVPVPPVVAPPSSIVPAFILPGGRHSLSGISLRAFVLGTTLGSSVLATLFLVFSSSELWRTPFFIVALSLFHFLEFYITATYNTPVATTRAFLLSSNGIAYNAAHTLALLETTLIHSSCIRYPYLLPASLDTFVLSIGFLLLLVGQTTRSLAMAQAGTNFNHTIQRQKARGHELVTTGIYGLLRHPSYFGFFWWGLGTQIVLGNAVCLAGYTVVLWLFFSSRIQSEEKYLTKFFGDQYVQYRMRTRVGIPFIQ